MENGFVNSRRNYPSFIDRQRRKAVTINLDIRLTASIFLTKEKKVISLVTGHYLQGNNDAIPSVNVFALTDAFHVIKMSQQTGQWSPRVGVSPSGHGQKSVRQLFAAGLFTVQLPTIIYTNEKVFNALRTSGKKSNQINRASYSVCKTNQKLPCVFFDKIARSTYLVWFLDRSSQTIEQNDKGLSYWKLLFTAQSIFSSCCNGMMRKRAYVCVYVRNYNQLKTLGSWFFGVGVVLDVGCTKRSK